MPIYFELLAEFAFHSNRKDDNIVRNVLNYTIFIKNDIEFKKFHKKE